MHKLELLSRAHDREVFESAGGLGLFVDAKDDAARTYYERFGGFSS